jgi:hypothetical protein
VALEDPKTIRKLWLGFYVVLGLLVVLDPKLLELAHILEHDPDHAAHFIVDGWPAFFAVYGFVTCWIMVMVSKLVLGKLLMRPEGYYRRSPLDPIRDAKGRRLPDDR